MSDRDLDQYRAWRAGDQSQGRVLVERHYNSLLLWGAEDGIVPPALEDAYARIGTVPDQKRLVLIPDVAHSPHDEDPDRFAEEVSDFIDAAQTYA